MNANERVVLADGSAVVVPLDASVAPDDDNDDEAKIERIHNVWGSSSGARSDFLGIYCKHRNAEAERLQNQEKQWETETENKIFQTIRYTRMQKELQKTAKRREKRMKKKNKITTSSKNSTIVSQSYEVTQDGSTDQTSEGVKSVCEDKNKSMGSENVEESTYIRNVPNIIIEEDTL
ncbi:uncharacterized protein BBOV_IV011280 [Babesia bovis T2Bo]|uniref:PRKR-interacting protein 1 n=1 Tax=Babesia bovis TaxID=5865 RepID=A7ASG1_BABBO|nr:uncharacterized protein BBOV_IV011280 [Babesia bovis T2Bo]EDO07480.1 hypothetical protein BBOV_IV011280 [Babesia bovis T2Bo]|eukprot:XP_001611048.1 hypothetical protein [Babesia bovis T2Bo]